MVCGKLDNWCAKRTSKHVKRDKFFQLKQEGKSIDQFMTEIRKQVKDCDFRVLQDDLVLHVLIRGMESERMWRRLFETENLNLERAIRMCLAMEAQTPQTLRRNVADKWERSSLRKCCSEDQIRALS